MGSTSQCVDYNFTGNTSGGFVSLGAGEAGFNNVSFDVFNPLQGGLPANFSAGEPVRGSLEHNSGGGTLQVTHRDRIGFFPNISDPAVQSSFMGGAIGSQSKVIFTATTTDNSITVPIKIEIDQDFSFVDPLANDTDATIDSFFLVTLTDLDGPQIIVDESGSVLFDSDGPDSIGGDYVGNFTESNPTPDELDGTLDIEIDISIDVNDPHELNSLESLGIFSDGFESGDAAAWTANSENTFIITISSSNPNVTFNVIPEPSTAALLLPGLLLLLGRRRRL